MDPILKLLDEEGVRLIARRYHNNDFAIARKALGVRYLCNINCAGRFIFRDDAEDIKAYPFFRGIEWSTLHLTRPPFVPRVSGDQSITKYFNDEAGILSESDYLDSSSYASDDQWRDGAEEADKSIKPQRESKFKRWNTAKKTADDTVQAKAPEKIRRRKKEKKRPRDKLLRDPEVGRTVLELRKKGLFIGYPTAGRDLRSRKLVIGLGARQSVISMTT